MDESRFTKYSKGLKNNIYTFFKRLFVRLNFYNGPHRSLDAQKKARLKIK